MYINELYPNIVSYSEGSLSRWRLGTDGHDHEALPSDLELQFLDEQCRQVNAGEKHFVCRCCGNARDKSEYYGFIFAAKYCVSCANAHPSIKLRYIESQKPGFYD